MYLYDLLTVVGSSAQFSDLGVKEQAGHWRGRNNNSEPTTLIAPMPDSLLPWYCLLMKDTLTFLLGKRVP